MPDLTSPSPKTILLVDDHPIVSLGLKSLVEESEDFVVQHVVTCNQEAVDWCGKETPDLIVLDLHLPGRNGLDVIPLLRQECSKTRIVVYSSMPEELYAARCIKAGACAYVHKESGPSQLIKALYGVLDGKIVVSESVQQDMLRQHSGHHASGDDLSVLSNQELHVFRLIGSGLRSSDIATKLGISPKTVGSHRERIKNKLTLHSGKELDQLAMSRFSSFLE